MIDLEVNIAELAETVAAATGRRYRLSPLKRRCTYPVFRGVADGSDAVFVKIGTRAEWLRTAALLRDVGSCWLFAKLLTDAPADYRGYAVFISEWKAVRTVFPEDMTDVQAENFVEACARLSGTLQGVRGVDCGEDSPETLHEELMRYIGRHPLAGRMLTALRDIPEKERTYGGRPLAVVHGDFHAKNFGFDGVRLAAVFDFDRLVLGLACGDFVNALVERFSCLGLPAAARRRLRRVAAMMFSRSPWPSEELVIAANVLRLRFAVRRIRRHPGSSWVALDILRRDRGIREVLRYVDHMEKGACRGVS